jgi:hypothetical protein
VHIWEGSLGTGLDVYVQLNISDKAGTILSSTDYDAGKRATPSTHIGFYDH